MAKEETIIELKELDVLLANIQTRPGVSIYFYKESEEETKRYLKKYEELALTLKQLNPRTGVIFTKINVENAKEIQEKYQITLFPCIWIYYCSEKKIFFSPTNKNDLEFEVNK